MELEKLDVVHLLLLRRSAGTSQRLFGGHGGERAYRQDLWIRVRSRVERELSARHIPFGDEGRARDTEDALLLLLAV